MDKPVEDLTPLRLAFLGGGINSAVGGAHFSACRMDGRFQLVAGCFSRNPATNRASGLRYGVPAERTFAHLDEMIQKEKAELDAVVVLTPTPSHAPHIIALLDAGIPIICEKALVATTQDADNICAAEQNKGGFLAVSYNYTGYPALREMREIVRSGRLGKLLHLVAEMPQEGYLRCDAKGEAFRIQDWRLRDGQIPGVHLDLGIHLHQIVGYVTGLQPLNVSAYHASFGAFPDVIDYVTASAEYSGGVHAAFSFGKSMLGHRNGLRIRLFGDKGSIEWLQMNPEELRCYGKSGVMEVIDRGGHVSVANDARYTRFKAGHPAGYIEAFANVYADIYNCLQSFRLTGHWQSEEVFGSQAARQGLRFLQKMTEAGRTGNRVAISN